MNSMLPQSAPSAYTASFVSLLSMLESSIPAMLSNYSTLWGKGLVLSSAASPSVSNQLQAFMDDIKEENLLTRFIPFAFRDSNMNGKLSR